MFRRLAGAILVLSPLGSLCLWVDPSPGAVRITHDGGFKQHLQWSPDGSKFLFTRIHQGKMGLWLIYRGQDKVPE